MRTHRANHDPTYKLTEILLARDSEKHFPSITEPKSAGALLMAIDGYEANS